MSHNPTTKNMLAHAVALPDIDGGPQTMSAQEIADLTGKTLKNVIRDVKRMAEALYKDGSTLIHPDAPSIPGITVERDGRGYITQVHLDRDHTMTMVTGYDVVLRHKIMKRWAELERANVAAEAPAFRIPTTLREALLLAAEQEEEIERQRAIADEATARAIETERTKAEIGSKREATAMNTARWAKDKAEKLEIELNRSTAWATVKRMQIAYGRKFPFAPLRAASREMGIEIKTVPDPNFDTVKAYHAAVWRAVYGIDVPGWIGSDIEGENP